jgi:hypothetical protein
VVWCSVVQYGHRCTVWPLLVQELLQQYGLNCDMQRKLELLNLDMQRESLIN